ncbi:hypothetical protein B7P43_G02246 [Cryptotermes secundus]|uniref:Uncharacterized protein n=1 Tax=Cryptotermes secundus TaxID=105785 RepID=A0A2J7PNG5_9NEOP|nr:general odorant-binding protein 72 [Cryptotermes secundus]PNF17880.1 hypothetical protein B7P43_G02246 [Cryptotermes secundus]
MNQTVINAILMVIIATALKNAYAELTMEEIISTGKILRSHCQPKVGVSDESIEAASEGRFGDDRELKCYLACMMGLSHSLKDGQYQADLVIQMADDLLPKDISTKVKNVVHKCRDAGNGIDDECEMAMALTKCAYAVDPQSFYLP